MEIKSISKTYGKKTVLKNVSLNLKTGRCFGLIGPNGAGKSTLMKIICGIIPSDHGDFKHIGQKNGYVPQDVCLEETLSAEQNLYFFGSIAGLEKSELHQKSKEVLTLIGLTSDSNQKVNTFSGGMKRRLNIGCALMNDPNLIILDEPTVGIDPESRKHILQLVQKLKTEDKIILYSTHYMEEAEKICDDIAFLDKGEVIEQTSMSDLIHHHAVPCLYFQYKEQEGRPITPEIFGDVQHFANGYQLTSENLMQTMENVLSICKENHLELTRFELMNPRLEDIFFKITGSTLQA